MLKHNNVRLVYDPKTLSYDEDKANLLNFNLQPFSCFTLIFLDPSVFRPNCDEELFIYLLLLLLLLLLVVVLSLLFITQETKIKLQMTCSKTLLLKEETKNKTTTKEKIKRE